MRESNPQAVEKTVMQIRTVYFTRFPLFFTAACCQTTQDWGIRVADSRRVLT